jgi:hypothetical protein
MTMPDVTVMDQRAENDKMRTAQESVFLGKSPKEMLDRMIDRNWVGSDEVKLKLTHCTKTNDA